MFCHSNVQNWNDSAAEEAFQNAKNLYWAKINSLPCDISLPDPDAYVHQIDWNPYIDPELIKEVDSTYFALPDEEQGNDIKNKRTKISGDGENSWECAGTPLSEVPETKVHGGNQGDYHVGDSADVDNADNPWECSITHGNGGLTDNAWEGGRIKSWGLNEGRDDDNQNRDWDTKYSHWGNDCLGIPSQKDKGWGKVRDSSWGQQQQSNNLPNIGNPWGCKASQHNVTPKNTGWRNRGANVSGWKEQENADVSSDLQWRRNSGGGTAWNQRFHRREGSNRHAFGYNGSQFQRDDRQTGHYWRRDNSKKRDFAP